MQVSISVENGILTASPAGEIDHHNASKIIEAIDMVTERNKVSDIVFDMKKVLFMDSAGIGIILGRYNKILKTGGNVYIKGESEYVRRLLEMAGVFKIIKRLEPESGVVNGE